MNTHELLEKKKALVKEATEIRDRVYKERNGEWLGDETAKFDSLMAESDKVQAEIERSAKLAAAERSILEASEPQGRRSEPMIHQPSGSQTRHFGAVTEKDRTEGLRAWMLAGKPDAPITDRQRDTARRCGIDLGAKSLTLSFGPVLKSTSVDDMREWNQAVTEQRAALTGAQSTTTTGGYTVADELMRSL